MAATYTVKQVADILGYSTNSIYTFLKEKRIKGVRVGKGRFRIPQGEIDRLLATKGSSPTSAQTAQQSATLVPQASPGSTGSIEPPLHGEGLEWLGRIVKGSHGFPSLYECFLTIVSVVLGFSIFLFNRRYQDIEFERYAFLLTPVAISLIVAGIGLIAVGILGKKEFIWHKFFHLVLVIAYAVVAVTMAQTSDWDGVTIFGILSFSTVLSMFFSLGSIASFALFIVMFFVTVPVALFFSRSGNLLPSELQFITNNKNIWASVWVGLSATLLFCMIWAYSARKFIFWIILASMAGVLMGLSLWYAYQLLWSQAFLIILMGLTSVFAPIWSKLASSRSSVRSFIYAAFGVILSIFLVAIGVIALVQQNIASVVKEDLQSKVTYAQIFLESVFSETESSLERAAVSPIVASSLQKGNTDLLIGLARDLFEENIYFHRIAFTNSAGDIVAVYPYTTLESSNLSGREYFQEAIRTKKAALSDLIISIVSGKTPVIVRAVPVLKQNEIVGMIVASYDLTNLGYRLQQIANTGQSEYFTIVDGKLNRIIHPDQSLIGTEVEKGNVLQKVTQGTRFIEGYNSYGIRVYEAIGYIESLSWTIAIVVPVVRGLQQTNTSSFIVFFAALGILASIGAIVFIRFRGWVR